MHVQDVLHKATDDQYIENVGLELKFTKNEYKAKQVLLSYEAVISGTWELMEKNIKPKTFTDLKRIYYENNELSPQGVKCLKFGWESGIERGIELTRQNHKDLIDEVKYKIKNNTWCMTTTDLFKGLLRDLGYLETKDDKDRKD